MTEEIFMRAIVAMDEDNTIAIEGEGIPWNIKEDHRHLKREIKDRPVLMGRKTFEAMSPRTLELTGKRIILTRDRDYEEDLDNTFVFNSKSEAKLFCKAIDEPIYNLGGAEIYELFFDEFNQLIVSHIDGSYADPDDNTRTFPEISADTWTVTKKEEYDDFTVNYYSRTSADS